jgi:2-aminoadipate transaminase
MATAAPLLQPVAQWARDIRISPLQRALAAAADPTVLSLSLGLPDPAFFPMEAFRESAARVLGSNRNSLQYSLPCDALKVQICKHMADRGVNCFPDNVFLTSGAQQGLSLLARLLIDPGACVLEEEYSYTAFQQAIEPYTPNVIQIPSGTGEGIDVDALDSVLRRGGRPAFLYLMTDGHNPLGATVPLENRKRLASLAAEFGIPVVEDDPYGSLSYERELPPLRAFESNWVYYVGSLSKLLAPSLRIGWLIVPAPLGRLLSIIKEASDLNLSTLSQWIAADYLESGALPEHIRLLRTNYGIRRSAMDAAMRRFFPAQCHWSVPDSGVFYWVNLPEWLDASELLPVAIQNRVAFLPAEAFSRGKHRNGIRLNFSRCSPDEITEGICRLGTVLRNAIQSR